MTEYAELMVKNTFLSYQVPPTPLRRSKSAPAPLAVQIFGTVCKSQRSRWSDASTDADLGTDSESASDSSVEQHCEKFTIETVESRTTVMLRNLPNNYTREMMLQHLDGTGFAGLYDFFYMPVDFTSQASLGYAFVNFATPRDAQSLMTAFDGFSDWVIPTRKRCYVNWSHPHQGLTSNIERYRNSPVMHRDVPDAFKPVIFDHGVRMEFPTPTRRLRCPRLRGMTINQPIS